MRQNEINNAHTYINPATGSIDTGESWLADFAARDAEMTPTWEDWGGDKLVRMVQDEDGVWCPVR